MVYTEGSASETTEYIGGLMEKVSGTSGTQYRYYVYGSSGLAAVVGVEGSTATPHYVLEDHEGSISSLLNATGSVAVSESFTAFGNRREPSTWSGAPSSIEEATADGITRQGFTGQTALGQMGLNHMNGRIEDAVSGTFLSPDPYVSEPYNTQDNYRYAYTYNNPLTNIDPSGFHTECAYMSISNPQSDEITGRVDASSGGLPMLPGVSVTSSQLPVYCFDVPDYAYTPESVSAPLPGNLGGLFGGGVSSATSQQSNPCGGGGNGGGGNSNNDELGAAAAGAGLTISDIGLQAADRFTANIKAPPGVDLGAIGVVGKGVTALGLGMSLYQTFYGSTSQARAQGAQDTAVNGLGAVAPEVAPFTSIPYDLGRMARELYDAWKNQQAAQFLDSIAQCHGG